MEKGTVSMAGERTKMRRLRRTRRERQMGFVVSQGDMVAINDEVRKQSGLSINGGGMTENGTHEIGRGG